MLRSASRFHALDETALFGCACRHEFPRLFINLRHGERYGVNYLVILFIVYLFLKIGICCVDDGKYYL